LIIFYFILFYSTIFFSCLVQGFPLCVFLFFLSVVIACFLEQYVCVFRGICLFLLVLKHLEVLRFVHSLKDVYYFKFLMLTKNEAESEWAGCNVSVLPISVT